MNIFLRRFAEALDRMGILRKLQDLETRCRPFTQMGFKNYGEVQEPELREKAGTLDALLAELGALNEKAEAEHRDTLRRLLTGITHAREVVGMHLDYQPFFQAAGIRGYYSGYSETELEQKIAQTQRLISRLERTVPLLQPPHREPAEEMLRNMQSTRGYLQLLYLRGPGKEGTRREQSPG